MKDSQLHGEVGMENAPAVPGANKQDASGDLGKSVREAVVLDRIEGGSGTAVSERIASFMKENPECIEHSEVDELYPKT